MIENNEVVQVLKEREIIQLSEAAKAEWQEIEPELFENKFENDEEKEQFLQECFVGKRKFPWHAQGQSIKMTDAKVINAAIVAGGIGILGGTLTGRPEYEVAMAEANKIPSKQEKIDIGRGMNKEAILKEIETVRAEHPHAILGVNILHSIGDFEETVKAIGDQGMVDILYVGAGLCFNLSGIMEAYPKMRYMAIVSSGKAVKALEGRGDGKRRPDGYVYEDKIAAGHNETTKQKNKDKTSMNHIEDMKEAIGRDENGKISKPIIFAGGVKYQEDVQKALLSEENGGMGLNGVGLGTRVLITDESPVKNDILKSIHLNPEIDVVRREKFSSTKLPSTGKINEKLFWEKVEELELLTKQRCNNCLISDNMRDYMKKNYDEVAKCGFMSIKPADINYKFCIAFFLDAAIKGEPWGLYFMSAINEQDSIYVDEKGEKHIPTVNEMVDYVIRGKEPERKTVEPENPKSENPKKTKVVGFRSSGGGSSQRERAMVA